MEIGIDCVDISRFKKSNIMIKKSFRRIFTENEINYCEKKENPAQHFAIRFAGKEAVKKALSGLNIDIALKNIEIKINKPLFIIDNLNKRNVLFIYV